MSHDSLLNDSSVVTQPVALSIESESWCLVTLGDTWCLALTALTCAGDTEILMLGVSQWWGWDITRQCELSVVLLGDSCLCSLVSRSNPVFNTNGKPKILRKMVANGWDGCFLMDVNGLDIDMWHWHVAINVSLKNIETCYDCWC